jgi:hypothetical protein
MVQDLIRKGLLPKPRDHADAKPSTLHMTFEELRQKNADDKERKFERLVELAEKDLASTRIKWGPRSVAHARLENIRSSPERTNSLAVFVKEELPKIRRSENSHYYAVDILKRNRHFVAHQSSENEMQKQLKAARRSQR